MPSTRLTIATAAIGLFAASSALADVLVVRALGPSAARYVAGRSIPDNTRIVLRQGDQLVLLDPRGTRTLIGPGVFSATGGPSGGTSTLVALAGNAGDRRNRVGAVRNLPTTNAFAIRPNIFLVDVAAPGNVCIVDPAGATLWRAAVDRAGHSIITAPDGTTATVDWIKGQSTQPWPIALPIVAGRAYRVGPVGGGAPVAMSFALLTQPPADLPELAKALITRSCKAQIDVMVATTGAAGAP